MTRLTLVLLLTAALCGPSFAGMAGTGASLEVPPLPPDLERSHPQPGSTPVILAPGLFLAPAMFREGPRGGLARVLHRRRFDVFLWHPWLEADGLDDTLLAARRAIDAVQAATGRKPFWLGVDLTTLVGVLAAAEGAPLAGVAGLGPRLELNPCPKVMRTLLEVRPRGPEQRLLLTRLWSWRETSVGWLEPLFERALAQPSTALSSQLARACGSGPALTRLPLEAASIPASLPVAFFASPRDGMAPLEQLLPLFDALSAANRRLFIEGRVPAPGHLELLFGRRAPDLYRAIGRWLREPTPDLRSPLPMLPGPRVAPVEPSVGPSTPAPAPGVAP